LITNAMVCVISGGVGEASSVAGLVAKSCSYPICRYIEVPHTRFRVLRGVLRGIRHHLRGKELVVTAISSAASWAWISSPPPEGYIVRRQSSTRVFGTSAVIRRPNERCRRGASTRRGPAVRPHRGLPSSAREHRDHPRRLLPCVRLRANALCRLRSQQHIAEHHAASPANDSTDDSEAPPLQSRVSSNRDPL